jgi:hypothetical protein
MPGLFCWMLYGGAWPAVAVDQGGPEDRLQRLEQRVNDLADRQEQIAQHLGGPPERPRPMGQPGLVPQPGVGPGLGADTLALRTRLLHRIADTVGLVTLVWIICNVLVAVWIYSDIRKRGEGSGIFIALAVVAGIPAAIIYSLVRIADKLPSPTQT